MMCWYQSPGRRGNRTAMKVLAVDKIRAAIGTGWTKAYYHPWPPETGHLRSIRILA